MAVKEDTPTTTDWGRRKHANLSNGIKATALMLASPTLTLLLTTNMKENHGNLTKIIDSDAFYTFWQSLTFERLLQMHQIIAGYLIFQAILYKFLPGPQHTGQHTPDGQLLQYKTNGMLAFAVTCACFWLGDSFGLWKASFIASNFGVLVAALNIWGLVLTVAAYVKACLSPTSSRDRVFTGNMIYDICMGVELNPRAPIIDDVKIFVVGRVGMMLWPLILASFTCLQYEKTGNISGAMLVGVALQYEYIIDFFWNEHWYLRTIDIAHDHVGFYIVWGCFAWLPSTYTLHAQFMAYSKVAISDDLAAFYFMLGTAGYILFRLANNQKYRVRETLGQCSAWGKPATYITARYITADGAERESILLTCGWWGVSRHFNYVGDMVFSFATCATTGFGALLPWFYAIFLWTLLFHRCIRDEARCAKKYGHAWQTYCAQVRWRLVPYLI